MPAANDELLSYIARHEQLHGAIPVPESRAARDAEVGGVVGREERRVAHVRSEATLDDPRELEDVARGNGRLEPEVIRTP